MSDKQQSCYYDWNKKDELFNQFLSVRKQSTGYNIIFEIEHIIYNWKIEETNNGDISNYNVTNELKEFNKNGRSNDNGQKIAK